LPLKALFEIMSSLNLSFSLLMIPSESTQSASFWLDKGNELCNCGQMEDALKAYDKALSIDGSLVDAWNNKGIILANLGRYSEALQCFDEAIAIDPYFAGAWYNKALALQSLGRGREAMAAMKTAKALEPTARGGRRPK